MTQTATFSIPNSGGSVLRATLNEALAALITQNSGPSAPSTTYPNMWWFDTSTLILYKRDNGDTKWLPVGQESGGVWVPISGGIALNSASLAITGSVNNFTGRQSFGKGSDLASASTLTLGTDGNIFDVTGTTTITAISDTTKIGTKILLQFDAALQITHSSALSLPNSENITTVAGDVLEFVQTATGPATWICTNYRPASSSPVDNTGPYTFISEETVTSDSVVYFTDLPDSFSSFEILFDNVRPGGALTTGTLGFGLRLSNDGGASYAFSGYQYKVVQEAVGGNLSDTDIDSNNADTGILVADGSVDSTWITNGRVQFFNINTVGRPCIARCEATVQDGTSIATVRSTTTNAALTRVNAIQLRSPGGAYTIDTGAKFRLYGIKGA